MTLNKVVAYLKALKIKPRVGKFTDRIIIQKITYLLKKFNLDISYSFSLYIRGPYSPKLTRDIYAHKKQIENLKTNYRLTNRELEIINRLKENLDILSPSQLEIVATYVYLKKDHRLTEDMAIKKLKELKPYSEVKIAIGVSKAKCLFPISKKGKEWIQKETEKLNKLSNEALEGF